ncbi:MAG: hypothetical protein AAGG08_06155 [Actinomycetota bacterium]
MTTEAESPRSALPVPSGTIPVGGALLIAGIATYAFFRVGAIGVGGDDEFQPIVSMWFATFALAPGFFLPLEQELARAISSRRALGQGAAPVVRKVLRLGLLLTGLIATIILVTSPLYVEEFFDGQWLLVIAFAAAFAAYAPAHLARGICSGNDRFDSYAIVMGGDGVARIALCAALAIVGIELAGAYGFAIAASPVIAVAWVWRRGALRNDDGPEASWAEVTPNLGWLLVGSACSAALLNAGPLAATVLADDSERALVTEFSFGVLLARIPLFLFQAVQAALLPKLARLATRGEFDDFRTGLRQLLYLVGAVGVVGTAGAFVLGPFAVEVVYDADLSGRTMAALALGSACYMFAMALGQAVIALHGHALVALGWSMAVVAFVLGTWLSSDQLFRRVEIGLLISSMAAVICFAVALRVKLAQGEQPDQGSVMDAITDVPFEG